MKSLARFLYIFLHFNKFSIKKGIKYFLVIAIIISFCNSAYSFQITLSWDPNTEFNLAGYKVYYGTASRNYAFSVDVGEYAEVTISGLEPGKRYYFAATAYDLDGNESNLSDEITFPAQKSMPWIQSLLLDN